MPVIYGFLNGGSREWWRVMAISEDGHVLGGHVCSHECFFLGDLGFIDDADWSNKREKYDEHYPDGYTLEWVEREDIAGHAGLQRAFALGTAMQENESTESE